MAAGGRSLVVRETPGHTRGHVVFVDETTADAGMLFAGDHVLPHITPSIGFEPAARPGALTRFLTSLAALRTEAAVREVLEDFNRRVRRDRM